MAMIQRPFNPFLQGGVGFDPSLYNPQPTAEQPQNVPRMPGQVPMQPPPQSPPQNFQPPPPAQVASGFPLAALAGMGQPEGGGGLKQGIGDFLGSDASLAFASGLLGSGTSSDALGRAFGNAYQARQKQAPASTDDLKEYAFAKQQGYAGSFPEYMMSMKKAGSSSVNVNTGAEVGTIPQGYELFTDPESGARSMRAITGGPEDISGKEAATAAQKAKYADVVTEDIDRAIDGIENATIPVTGLGSMAAGIPGTDAHNVSMLVETIKANAGFDRLQEMRNASPTGGALGQVSNFENQLLQATIGNLALSQTQDQLVYNLKRVKRIYTKIVNEGIKPGDPLAQFNFGSGAGSTDQQPTRRRYNPATGVLE